MAIVRAFDTGRFAVFNSTYRGFIGTTTPSGHVAGDARAGLTNRLADIAAIRIANTDGAGRLTIHQHTEPSRAIAPLVRG